MADTHRGNVLNEAQCLVEGFRAEAYGDPTESAKRIAAVFNVLRGKEINAEDVWLLLALVKLDRLSVTPGHGDSYVDACGYIALASEAVSRKLQDLGENKAEDLETLVREGLRDYGAGNG